MSIPQGPAYREGIWEIRETTITALFPEGPWVLVPADIEYIRLQDGTENGLPFCDAFIKPRNNDHSYPVGRYATATEGICKVLSQYAYWNNVTLKGSADVQSAAAQTGSGQEGVPVGHVPRLSAQTPLKSRRHPADHMPKSPDYPAQTMNAPETVTGFSQHTDSSTPEQEVAPGAEPHVDAGFGQNPDFSDQQGFAPPPGYNPESEFQNQMPWYQWLFHPANPNFRKTILAVSVLGAILLAAILFGGFRGVRMTSVSWPGIVAFIIISKEIKKRRQGRRNQKGPASSGQAWNRTQTWNQNQTWNPSDPWKSNANPWNGGQAETAPPPEQPDMNEPAQEEGPASEAPSEPDAPHEPDQDQF